MATQQTISPQPITKESGLLDRIVEQQAEVAARYQPVMSIQQLVEREKAIQYLVDHVMVEGVDYGWIPGTKPKEDAKAGEYRAKPTLFKAGAERACAFFGYAPKFIGQEVIEEWDTQKYGEMLFYYRYECTLTKDGHAVGSGIGSATTFESKYRYRQGARECPECGHEGAIIKGKADYGGGWLCFKKKGGCGAKFADGDERIEAQQAEKVPNPDVADVVNTVQKMAQKRAYVAATLTATGLSGRFTQDLEDLPAPTAPKTDAKAEPKPAPGPRQTKMPAQGIGAEERRVPRELQQVFANLDKDISSCVAAYSGLEGMFIKKAGDSGLAEYNRIADLFNATYPNGTNDKNAHRTFLLDLFDALQLVKPVEDNQNA